MRAARSAMIGVALAMLVPVAACGQRTEQARIVDHPKASGPAVGVPTTSSASAARTDRGGLVHGVVVRSGGTDPRSGHRAIAVGGDPVHAYDVDGRVVANAVTDAGGNFEFVLPAGTYRVVEDICRSSQQTVLRDQPTTPMIVTLSADC